MPVSLFGCTCTLGICSMHVQCRPVSPLLLDCILVLSPLLLLGYAVCMCKCSVGQSPLYFWTICTLLLVFMQPSLPLILLDYCRPVFLLILVFMQPSLPSTLGLWVSLLSTFGLYVGQSPSLAVCRPVSPLAVQCIQASLLSIFGLYLGPSPSLAVCKPVSPLLLDCIQASLPASFELQLGQSPLVLVDCV